jgi:hypothetical protein
MSKNPIKQLAGEMINGSIKLSVLSIKNETFPVVLLFVREVC